MPSGRADAPDPSIDRGSTRDVRAQARSTGTGGTLAPISRFWRVSVATAGLAILGVAQVVDTNDWFPLGSLSQYGAAKDPNGSVVSFHVEALTTTGERIPVRLTPNGVGVGRSEVESQVARIRADPSVLQGIVDAHAGLHPSQPAFVQVYLMREQRQLRDGRAVGEPTVREVVAWPDSKNEVVPADRQARSPLPAPGATALAP